MGTITVALGANDLLNFLDSCGDDAACVKHGLPKALNHTRANLDFIVKRLHKAAPDAVIVLLEYYNPFAPFDPDSSANLLALNAGYREIANLMYDATGFTRQR